jgi:dienelactone hydrolase
MHRAIGVFLIIVLGPFLSYGGKARLLICPDRFGTDSFIQAEKERWSDFGLEVFVVDFYGDKRSFSDPEAQQQWSQLPNSKIEDAIQKAFDSGIKGRQEGTEFGLIAFQESANSCLRFFGQNLSLRAAILIHPNFVREAAQGPVSDRRVMVVGAAAAKDFNKNAYRAYVEELKKRQFLVSDIALKAVFSDFYRSNSPKSFQPQFAFEMRKSSEDFFRKYLTFQDNKK